MGANAPARGSGASAATAVNNDSELHCVDPLIAHQQVKAHDDTFGMGYRACTHKRQKRGRLGPIVCYPKETGIRFHPQRMGGRHASVEGCDLMRRECQEAWSGIDPNFTESLAVDNKDITLDVRQMLAATGGARCLSFELYDAKARRGNCTAVHTLDPPQRKNWNNHIPRTISRR